MARSRAAEWARGLGLMAATLLVCLVIAEVVVRMIEPREVMRYFFMTADPVLNHRFIPNATGHYKTPEFDVVYRINALGLRDRPLTADKPGGVRRVLMLGDSFTEGDGVEAHDAFPARLQGKLDSAGAGRRWEVINAGVGSYSSLLEYLYLVNGGLALNPDMVVLNFDLSDVHDDIRYTSLATFDSNGVPVAVRARYQVGRSKDGSVLGSAKDFIKDNVRLYNFVRLRLDRQFREAQTEVNWSGDIRVDKYAMLRPNYAPADDRDWELTFTYLALIRDTLRARGVDFLLTVYPYGHQVSRREWNAGRQYWMFRPDTVYSVQPQSTMEEFCRRSGIPVLNLCNDFRQEAGMTYPLYMDFNGHWTPAGHEVVARALHRHLTGGIAGPPGSPIASREGG